MSPQRFKPYPAYKDSGVEWLGEIPAHWEVKFALKFVVACARRAWGHRSGGAYGSGAGVRYIRITDIRDDGKAPRRHLQIDTRGRFHTLVYDRGRHDLRQEWSDRREDVSVRSDLGCRGARGLPHSRPVIHRRVRTRASFIYCHAIKRVLGLAPQQHHSSGN